MNIKYKLVKCNTMRKTHACKRAACVFCISLQFGCTYLGSYMHMGTKVSTSKHFQIHKCLKNCCSPPIKKTNVKMFAVRKRVSILFQNPLSCDTFHRQFVTSLYFGLRRFWRGVKKTLFPLSESTHTSTGGWKNMPTVIF